MFFVFPLKKCTKKISFAVFMVRIFSICLCWAWAPWLLIRFFSAFVLLGISFEVFEWNEMEKTFLNFTINPWIPLTKVQHMPLFLFEISKHTFVCTEIFKWNSFLWNSDRFTSCAHTQITHIIKNIRYIIVFSSNVL